MLGKFNYCTEEYNLPKDNAAYSAYVLSGKKSLDCLRDMEYEYFNNIMEKYTTRKWENYINRNQKGESANVLFEISLEDWIRKHTGENPLVMPLDPESWMEMGLNQKYLNLIDNFSFYWFGDFSVWFVRDTTTMDNYDSTDMYLWNPSDEEIQWCTIYNCMEVRGVRVLVTLSSDVQFKATKTGTKTLTGGNMNEFGGDQTYNVWDIAEEYSEVKVELSSEKYEIDDKYILNIQPETTVSTFKNNIATNATEINIYNQNNPISKDTDKIGTGMELELKKENQIEKFTLIVKGDVDGDGASGMTDILKINQHRLNKKNLDEIYLKAGDIIKNGKADFADIIKINSFRLHKITEL